MDWNSIVAPVVAEATTEVILPIALALASMAAAWVGVRVHKLTGVKIDAELNTLLHNALQRAVAAARAKYGSQVASPSVIAGIVNQLHVTNPDSAPKSNETLTRLVGDEIARQTEGTVK